MHKVEMLFLLSCVVVQRLCLTCASLGNKNYNSEIINIWEAAKDFNHKYNIKHWIVHHDVRWMMNNIKSNKLKMNISDSMIY